MHFSVKRDLPSSERFYAGIFDSIGSPILIIDPQTAAILDVNKAACKFYGYSYADFIQKKILDLAVIPAEEAWTRIHKIAAGEITHMALPHRLASGEIRDVEVDLGRDLLGDTPVNIATVHDVTEREQVKKKLQESETRLRSVMSSMSEGVVVESRSGEIIFCNQRAEEILGLTADQMVGRTSLDPRWRSVHEDGSPFPGENHPAMMTLRTGQPCANVIMGVHLPEDDLRWISINSEPIYLEGPEYPSAVVATFVDVTESRRTVEFLRESEKRFLSVFQTSPVGINVFNASTGRAVVFNDAFLELTGYSREEITEHSAEELNLLTTPETANADWKQTLADAGAVQNLLITFRKKTGELRYGMASLATFKSQGQTLVASMTIDVTERKNAEFLLQSINVELEKRVQERTAELRRVLERLTLSTGAAKMGIWDWDIQKNELVWDQQMYVLYGVKPARFGGAYEAWVNGIHPDDRETSDQVSEQARKGEKPYDTEFRVLWPDGSLHWLKADGQVFWDEQGNPIRMLGVNYDITERKQAENKINESRFRTEMAIHGADAGTWEWNVQTGETVFNERWAQIVGYTLKELEPINIQTWITLCHPDDLKVSDEMLEKYFTGQTESYDCEVRMKHKDGSWVWVFDSGKIMEWTKDGKPLRMFGTHLNISTRKHAEEHLRKLTYLLEEGQKIGHLGTFEYIVSTGQTIWSEEQFRIYGYDPSSPAPDHDTILAKSIYPEEAELINRIFLSAVTREEVYELEHRIVHPDGSERWVYDNARPYFSQDGQLLRYIGISLDITERKRAEEKLTATNQTLERALRAKDEFLAAISHELRTPLAGIMGMTEMLQMTVTNSLSPKQVGYLAIIEQSSNRLLALINNLLEFTHLQSSTVALNLHPCILAEVCQTALQQIIPASNLKQQQTRLSLTPSEIILQTDENRLLRVLLSLLDNANKFTPAGGEFGIEVTGRSGDQKVDITVWDTGSGIAEENLHRLFKPFTQLDASLARQYEGVGLGLALVKGITESLGGVISVQSTLGKGSRFVITLPWK